MKKRIVIYSFYDKDGYLDKYKENIIYEFSKCVQRLIVVVNGILTEDSERIIKQYTKEVYIRENLGFDAGAYKFALNTITDKALGEFDELVFCNDTFFGPLIPFDKIFEKMDKRECDFWGLTGCIDILYPYIQSYFLVFRKRIIEKKILHEYFERFIDGQTEEINSVYAQFESGLFDYLVRVKKMKYSLYAKKSILDIYRNSYLYLAELNAPVVKKKSFSKTYFDCKNISNTLNYIKEKTEYNIGLITDCVERTYGLNVDFDNGIYYHIQRVNTNVGIVTEDEIEKFLGTASFYIYGVGVLGQKTYWRFARSNSFFKGFIISDEKKKQTDDLYGYPIYYYSEIDITKYKVLLAMKTEYTEEVIHVIGNNPNLMRLY